MKDRQQGGGRWRRAIRHLIRRAVAFGRRIPSGWRTLLGLLLIIGGSLGFLPVLGFWMIPLGVVLIILDLRDLRRRGARWLESRRPRMKNDQINHGQRPTSQPDAKARLDDRSVRC